MSIEIWITIIVFFLTMIVIFWRPRGLNEAWPAAIGAGIILITGLVSKPDVIDIVSKIGGASITILATIVMAVILESFGFFHWCSETSKFSKRWSPFILVYSITMFSYDSFI